MRMSPREAEFTAFLEARSGELMRFGYLLTRHEADAADLVQDALVQVWSRRSGVPRKPSMAARRAPDE
jgi:DNA-directed RNA polymerase specialized sigma24 family protein